MFVFQKNEQTPLTIAVKYTEILKIVSSSQEIGY